MTLPTSDAQFSGFLPPHPHSDASLTKRPVSAPLTPVPSVLPSTPPLSTPHSGIADENPQEHASDFAISSWDLATGGLKTLTAKRELPPRPERRPTDKLSETAQVPRSYAFLLVVLACLVLMLISGGVVLFVMLQP